MGKLRPQNGSDLSAVAQEVRAELGLRPGLLTFLLRGKLELRAGKRIP